MGLFDEIAIKQIQLLFPEVGLPTGIISLGDNHPNGQVQMLTFSSNRKFVAKPRSVVGEQLLYEIENSVFENLSHLSYSPVVFYSSSKLSIVEFLSSDVVSSIQKDKYFYLAGVKAAILFCLGATDIGYENVVAHNSTPVIVDAETLFTPDIISVDGKQAQWPFSAFGYSMSRTGFLPSNHIFSSVHNDRHTHLLKKNNNALLRKISQFPAIGSNGILHLTQGYIDGISSLSKLNDKKIIEKVIRKYDSDLINLRIMVRSTKTYLDYLELGITITDLFDEEFAQLQNGYVPYFTFQSFQIPFDSTNAISLFTDFLTFCARNPAYMISHIKAICT